MAALLEGPYEAEPEHVTFTGVDGATIDAISARPDDVEPIAGLVLHPDVMGIRPLFDDLTRRLATHGLAVCCPEPFARIPQPERDALGVEGRLARVRDFDDELQLGDLKAAADVLNVGSVFVVGFCMGGMYALKASATGRFERAVSFYGMIRVPDAWAGPKQEQPLAGADEMAPTLAILGGRDPWTPPADVEALRAAWANRPDCQIVMYDDADHGFVHDPERPAHRSDDAADAWANAFRFLDLVE